MKNAYWFYKAFCYFYDRLLPYNKLCTSTPFCSNELGCFLQELRLLGGINVVGVLSIWG